MTDGPYWNPKNQGMVATVVKASDVGTVTVRCDTACHDKSNNLISVPANFRWDKDWGSVGGKERKAGSLTTHQLCPSVPHSAGRPVFKYLCSK